MAKKKQQTVYSFGSSLRRAREKREYTREQIAERAGISPRFVSAIENDRRKPSLDVLIRLVHAIGTSFDEVLMPQTISEEYTADRIKRLITQCSQRDQELVLALIDQMLDAACNIKCERKRTPSNEGGTSFRIYFFISKRRQKHNRNGVKKWCGSTNT